MQGGGEALTVSVFRDDNGVGGGSGPQQIPHDYRITVREGAILGPSVAFQALSNGPDRSRLLSSGKRRTFVTTHVSD